MYKMSLEHLMFLEKEVFSHTHTHACTHTDKGDCQTDTGANGRSSRWPRLKQFDHKI